MAVCNPTCAEHGIFEEPLFRPLSHLPPAVDGPNVTIPGGAAGHFAAEVSAISRGLRTIMQITVDHELRRQNREVSEPRHQDRPLLRETDVEALHGLAVAVLTQLETRADDMMSWMYQDHTPEGREAPRG